MSVVVIGPERLPKLSRSWVRRSHALERRLFEVEDPLVVDLSGVGDLRISIDRIESGPMLRAREEFGVIGSDGRRGRIAVDLQLAFSLVSGALGRHRLPILRGLGLGERGILAGQIAAILGRLGSQLAVDVTGAGIAASESLASVGLKVETSAVSGKVRVDVPERWLVSTTESDGHLRAALLTRGGQLRTTARLELAVTRVVAAEWAAARPGDAVVFDGVPSIGSAAAWAIDLRIGDRAAAARLDTTGALSILEPFRPGPTRPGPSSMGTAIPTTKESSRMSSQPNEIDHSVLAGAPIEIVAEVGRLSLRGDEVIRLQPGSILPLGRRGIDVLLTAGGDSWARGELVDIDGELGVRIIALSISSKAISGPGDVR